MSSFGFGTSDNSDDAEKSAELAAALEAMQAEMKEQFEKLGVNPAGRFAVTSSRHSPPRTKPIA